VLPALDVIAQDASRAFADLQQQLPVHQVQDEFIGAAWELNLAAEGLLLRWNATATAIYISSEPFMAAGLEQPFLPGMGFLQDSPLGVPGFFLYERVSAPPAATVATSPQQAWAQYLLQSQVRPRLCYNMHHDLFSLELSSGGVAVAWAKDLGQNTVTRQPQDWGLSILLHPSLFPDASADSESIEGWHLAPFFLHHGMTLVEEQRLVRRLSFGD